MVCVGLSLTSRFQNAGNVSDRNGLQKPGGPESLRSFTAP